MSPAGLCRSSEKLSIYRLGSKVLLVINGNDAAAARHDAVRLKLVAVNGSAGSARAWRSDVQDSAEVRRTEAD